MAASLLTIVFTVAGTALTVALAVTVAVPGLVVVLTVTGTVVVEGEGTTSSLFTAPALK